MHRGGGEVRWGGVGVGVRRGEEGVVVVVVEARLTCVTGSTLWEQRARDPTTVTALWGPHCCGDAVVVGWLVGWWWWWVGDDGGVVVVVVVGVGGVL